jgi:HEAT repeat protein
MQQLEALDTLRRIQRIDSIAGQVCMQALRDPLPQLRAYAVQSAQFTDRRRDSLLDHIRIMAVEDYTPIVRAAAIAALGRARDTTSIPILLHALSDTSYAVEAQALRALHEMDSLRALRETNRYATETSYELRTAVYSIIATTGDSTYFPYLLDRLDKETSIAQYALVSRLADYVGRMTPSMADTAISRIKALIDEDDDRWLRRAAVSAVTQIKGDYELKAVLLPTKPTAATIREGEIYHRIVTHAREVLKAWKEEE